MYFKSFELRASKPTKVDHCRTISFINYTSLNNKYSNINVSVDCSLENLPREKITEKRYKPHQATNKPIHTATFQSLACFNTARSYPNEVEGNQRARETRSREALKKTASRGMMKVGDRTRTRRKPSERVPVERLTSVTFVKPWPEPPDDTCNELINLIYRRLTEIQSQMRGTLIVRPLATDTIVYTRGPYSLTIALQLVSPRSLDYVHDHSASRGWNAL